MSRCYAVPQRTALPATRSPQQQASGRVWAEPAAAPNTSVGTTGRSRLLRCPTRHHAASTGYRLVMPRSVRSTNERLGQHMARALLVEANQLRERDVDAARESDQRRERRVDLAALDRADVVAMQAGLKRERLLRETEPSAQLTNCSTKGPVRCRTRLARDTLLLHGSYLSCARPGGCPTTRRASICRSPRTLSPSPVATQHAFATNLRKRLPVRSIPRQVPSLPLRPLPALQMICCQSSAPACCPPPGHQPLAVPLAPRLLHHSFQPAQPTSCGVGRGRGSRVRSEAKSAVTPFLDPGTTGDLAGSEGHRAGAGVRHCRMSQGKTEQAANDHG